MDDIRKQRQYAAQLARKVYTGKIHFKQMVDDFPYDTKDSEIKELFDLVEHTPKQGGLFGVTKDKYLNYISTVYELIEKLEK
jgi:hypothetical protein